MYIGTLVLALVGKISQTTKQGIALLQVRPTIMLTRYCQ